MDAQGTGAKPAPLGRTFVAPHLVCADAADAIEFYKKAFGATEMMRMAGPGRQSDHARLHQDQRRPDSSSSMKIRNGARCRRSRSRARR